MNRQVKTFRKNGGMGKKKRHTEKLGISRPCALMNMYLSHPRNSALYYIQQEQGEVSELMSAEGLWIRSVLGPSHSGRGGSI